MRRPGRRRGLALMLAAATVALSAIAMRAQVAENARDPFGIAIPYRHVHLVHADDPLQEGTTAYLRARDPYLLYQLGRDLINRQFEMKHGILGRPADLSVPLYVGSPGTAVVHGGAATRFARDHAASCGMCHSSVYREPSAGQTIGSTGGMGRNTTHFFGAGLVEMIGEQVTRQILEAYDRNANGIIDRAELTASNPVRIPPAPGADPIDYGDLSPGPDGVPRLNAVFRIWYVDGDGRVLPDAVSLADSRAAGYGLAMQPFGWGRGYRQTGERRVSQGGEASTLREFYTVAADFHMGLEAHDPTQQGADRSSPGIGGLAGTSLNGAQQYEFGGSIDRGRRIADGVSQDDPDGDGHVSELTEGDVDAAEFFLLHVPAPAVRATRTSEAGRAVLARIGCTRCHTQRWHLPAEDRARGFKGDRRLFSLDARMQATGTGDPELTGTLVPRSRTNPEGDLEPVRGAYTVNGVYSDFKHWDIGPAFHERRFDGTAQTVHRTAPLWGVGNTGPYGHSGNFMDLRSVIRAHAGAAAAERDAFVALDAAGQRELLAFLESLVLFQTDEIPADIDGDGTVRETFEVAGQFAGYERFDARFLFRVPPRYDILGKYVHPNGRWVAASLITNIDEAYGLTLDYRHDSDGDGFADALQRTAPPPAGGGARK